MIPLLILSNNSNLINSYIGKFKSDSLFVKVTPSTKEYSIDDIKNIKKEVIISYPKTRVYFFPNFHLSSIPAQNSFLKLLEEPPLNVQFILTTDNKNNLLPTIVSRTKVVKLRSTETKSVVEQFIAPEINGVINLPAGRQVTTSTKLPLLSFKITDKESAKNILLQIINYFRTEYQNQKKSPEIIKEILRLNALLENNNLNPQLTVDQALIFVYKLYNMKQEVTF